MEHQSFLCSGEEVVFTTYGYSCHHVKEEWPFVKILNPALTILIVTKGSGDGTGKMLDQYV